MIPRLIIDTARQLAGRPQAVVETMPVDGLSAFQIAQRAGFAGTEAQWLASLRGANGDTRIRFVQSNLATDSAGVAVVALPVAGLAITVSPNTDGVVLKGKVRGVDAAGKPIVTVSFRRLNTGLLGITLQNLASIGIFQASVGVVSFDLFAAEPTA